MKKLKRRHLLLTTVLIIAVILFAVYILLMNIKSNEPPQISIGIDDDVFSVSDTSDVLLNGVTAYDKEDGDISSKIIIEPLSTFDNENKRVITYVVVDSDNNVTKVEKYISYSDYSSPEITADGELTFAIGTKDSDILSRMKCIDDIDGDISDKIIIQSSNLQRTKLGTYSITFSVANSCGDVISKTFDVKILN